MLRRFLQFRLMTLFIVMTVFGLWLGWETKWIRDRHRMLENHEAVILEDQLEDQIDFAARWASRGMTPATAPGGMWLIGERGVTELRVYINPCDPKRSPEAHEVSQRARRLFPEAELSFTCVIAAEEPSARSVNSAYKNPCATSGGAGP